jgi:hypothetical protein
MCSRRVSSFCLLKNTRLDNRIVKSVKSCVDDKWKRNICMRNYRYVLQIRVTDTCKYHVNIIKERGVPVESR